MQDQKLCPQWFISLFGLMLHFQSSLMEKLNEAIGNQRTSSVCTSRTNSVSDGPTWPVLTITSYTLMPSSFINWFLLQNSSYFHSIHIGVYQIIFDRRKLQFIVFFCGKRLSLLLFFLYFLQMNCYFSRLNKDYHKVYQILVWFVFTC